MEALRRRFTLMIGLAAAALSGAAVAGKAAPSLMSDADLDKLVGAGAGTCGEHDRESKEREQRDRDRDHGRRR